MLRLALTGLTAIAAGLATRLPLVDRLSWETCACDAHTFELEWGSQALASRPSSALLFGLAALSLFQVGVSRRRWLGRALTGVRALAAIWCLLALSMVAVSVWGTAAAWVLGSHSALLVLVGISLVAGRRAGALRPSR